MSQKRFTCLGVLLEGVWTGALFASDLKGLTHDHFERLTYSVYKFLKEIRSSKGQSTDHTVQCSATTTMRQIIHLLHQENVDRVFVIDNYMKPIGVVSLTDVLNECLLKK